MALKIECDGCGDAIPLHGRTATHDDTCPGCQRGHEGQLRGLLDAATYCPACAAAWDEYAAQEAQQRALIVQQFEAWGRRERGALRHRLRKLPDDWDAE